jgi:hypothetical protein
VAHTASDTLHDTSCDIGAFELGNPGSE